MNNEIKDQTNANELTPYQLFFLDVKRRNEEFFKELTPIEINRRIAYQWTLMNQIERRAYYERCGIHIDKIIASKIRKLNKELTSSNESINSDEVKDSNHDHANNNNNDNDDQIGIQKSVKELTGSDEDIEYSTPKKRKGRHRKGYRRNNFDSYSNADNEDNYVPPRRGRGGRRRK